METKTIEIHATVTTTIQDNGFTEHMLQVPAPFDLRLKTVDNNRQPDRRHRTAHIYEDGGEAEGRITAWPMNTGQKWFVQKQVVHSTCQYLAVRGIILVFTLGENGALQVQGAARKSKQPWTIVQGDTPYVPVFMAGTGNSFTATEGEVGPLTESNLYQQVTALSESDLEEWAARAFGTDATGYETIAARSLELLRK